MTRLARRLARSVLDALLPPRCLACGALTAEPGALCADCFGQARFLSAPLCDRCGDPFELPMEPGAICAVCAADPPPWGRARAVLAYDDGVARDLILRFKHADRTDSAPTFARWMLRAGEDVVRAADLIAPVPLHRGRLLKRRYNQSALLALHLDRLSGRPGRHRPDLLLRARATAPQEGKGRAARRSNIRGAFALGDAEAARDRRVLLIDDVLTTGATVGECARLLLRHGARAVDVLTVAKVILEPDWTPDADGPY